MQQIIENCEGGYTIINNIPDITEKEKEEAVRKILQKIYNLFSNDNE